MYSKNAMSRKDLLALNYQEDNPQFIALLQNLNEPIWKPETRLYFEEQGSPLYIACLENKKNIVKALLKAGADVNPQSNKNNSPLFIACKMGYVDIVALLIKHGAEVQSSKQNNESPLLAACAINDKNIIKLLLSAGVQVNLPDKDGQTPLFKALEQVPAVSLKSIKNLIDAGADLKHKDNQGNTILDLVFAKLIGGGNGSKWYFNILKQLLHAGVDVLSRVKPDAPFTYYDLALTLEIPLLMSILNEHIVKRSIKKRAFNPAELEHLVCELIISHYEHTHGLMVSFLTALNLSLQLAKEMLQSLAPSDLQFNSLWHRLLTACLQEDLPTVEYLLQLDKLLESTNDLDVAPLDIAIFTGNDELISRLLEHSDIRINQCSKNSTLLIQASRYGHLSLVNKRLTIDNINAKDESYFTALEWACKNGHNSGANLLLQDRNIKLDRALYHSLVSILSSSGNLFLLNKLKQTPGYKTAMADSKATPPLLFAAGTGWASIVLDELAMGVNVNCTDPQGRTALYLACESEHIKLVKILLENNADAQLSYQKETPLSIACTNGNLEIIKMIFSDSRYKGNQNLLDSLLIKASELGNLEIILWLIEQRGNVNFRDDSGNTPLHKATQEGHIDIVRHLLSCGAMSDLKNSQNQTAERLARQNGNIIIYNMLKLNLSCPNVVNYVNQDPLCMSQLPIRTAFWNQPNESDSNAVEENCCMM